MENKQLTEEIMNRIKSSLESYQESPSDFFRNAFVHSRVEYRSSYIRRKLGMLFNWASGRVFNLVRGLDRLSRVINPPTYIEDDRD